MNNFILKNIKQIFCDDPKNERIRIYTLKKVLDQ